MSQDEGEESQVVSNQSTLIHHYPLSRSFFMVYIQSPPSFRINTAAVLPISLSGSVCDTCGVPLPVSPSGLTKRISEILDHQQVHFLNPQSGVASALNYSVLQRSSKYYRSTIEYQSCKLLVLQSLGSTQYSSSRYSRYPRVLTVVFSTFGTPGTRGYSAILALGTPGREYSFIIYSFRY